MKTFLTRALTVVRDTLSGRSRLARYTYPDAHRHGHGHNDRNMEISQRYRANGSDLGPLG